MQRQVAVRAADQLDSARAGNLEHALPITRMGDREDTSWFKSHPLNFADVGSPEIAYRTVGSGPPLLMIHGWPVSGLTFRALARRLSPRFTCILPDTPGLGETRWRDDTSFAFTSQVATLRTFVDRPSRWRKPWWRSSQPDDRIERGRADLRPARPNLTARSKARIHAEDLTFLPMQTLRHRPVLRPWWWRRSGVTSALGGA